MSYSLIQSVFMMSYASNGASSILGTQATLQQRLEVYLNGGQYTDPLTGSVIAYDGFFPMRKADLIGGDWAPTWGPCVYNVAGTDVPGMATNAMYVAYSQSQNTYVVAIGATDPMSLPDWMAEDANVKPEQTAAWPPTLPFTVVTSPTPPNPTDVYVSAGTATGISNLLTKMADPKTGQGLQAYLDGLDKAGQTLVVCGHSLGGALAPSLAFYLYPAPATSGWANVYVLPTAGASPGSPGFAAAFSQAFPPLPVPGSTPLFNWNTDIANAIDIVPHAWDRLPLIIQPDAAGNFASLFGVMAGTSSNPLVPALGKTIATAVSKAETMSGGALYYQHLPMIQFSTAKDYYSWICDNQGNYTYPPQKLALPVYTDTVTTSSVGPMTTLAELGQYLDATHIDHYLFFFDVMPIARMPDPLKGKLQTLAHEAKAG